MSTEPDDLIERLRLVLDEREKTALAAIQGPWYTSTRKHLSPYVVYGASPLGGDRIVQVCNIEAAWQRHENAAFMVANGPDVALRTIQAHRKILARHRLDDDAPAGDPFCSWCGQLHQADLPDYPCDDLRDLASIYFPEGTG